METSEVGGAKPHNLDQSSPKPLPEKKEVGSGVKKSESQSLRDTKTPAGGTPDERESKLSQPNPAEKQAHDRLGKPPPEEAVSTVDNSIQEQFEPQASKQEETEELDFDFPPEVFPSATYVNPLKIDRRDKPNEKR